MVGVYFYQPLVKVLKLKVALSFQVEIQESTFSSYSIPAVADKRPASSNGGKLGLFPELKKR